MKHKGGIDQWRSQRFKERQELCTRNQSVIELMEANRSLNSQLMAGHLHLGKVLIAAVPTGWPDRTASEMLTVGGRPLGKQPLPPCVVQGLARDGILQPAWGPCSQLATGMRLGLALVDVVCAATARRPPLLAVRPPALVGRGIRRLRPERQHRPMAVLALARMSHGRIHRYLQKSS